MYIGTLYLQILIYIGEYTRDRNIKPKALLLEDEHGEVTGLAFRTIDAATILFVSTTNAVFSFDVTNKDREGKVLMIIGSSLPLHS
jgi:hypothetical protein